VVSSLVVAVVVAVSDVLLSVNVEVVVVVAVLDVLLSVTVEVVVVVAFVLVLPPAATPGLFIPHAAVGALAFRFAWALCSSSCAIILSAVARSGKRFSSCVSTFR